MNNRKLSSSRRMLNGVGIAPGVGTGSVVLMPCLDRTGFLNATGNVVVCDTLKETDVALLVQRRPVAVVVTGPISHSVAIVLQDARIPTVVNVLRGPQAHPFGATAVVDGARGQVWQDVLLVPADIARR